MVEVGNDTAALAPPIHDYSEFEGQGFEGQSQDDVSIPFISILQAQSPQVEEQGLPAGKLYNAVTGDTYDDLKFVPVITEHCYIAWAPRDTGGGFRGRFPVDSPVVMKARKDAEAFNKMQTEEGDELRETFYVYGVKADDHSPIVIGFSSTKIKVYKRWATAIRMFTIPVGGRKIRPPLFAHQSRLSTIKQQNSKGKFYNFTLDPAERSISASLLDPQSELFQAAQDVRRLILEGKTKIEGEQATGSSPDDEGTPF